MSGPSTSRLGRRWHHPCFAGWLARVGLGLVALGCAPDDVGAQRSNDERAPASWSAFLEAELVSLHRTLFLTQDPDNDGGEENVFGYAVSVSGNTALIGSPGDDIGGNLSQGSAHVYVRNGTTWAHQAKLVAAQGSSWEYFGRAVSLSGDTALIGATKGAWPLSASRVGAAYVFVRSGATWTQQARLLPSDSGINDDFGVAVSVRGDTALIGKVPLNAGQPPSSAGGAAHVFVRSGTAWSEQARLTGSDAADGSGFGVSVSLSGDTALIGAPWQAVAGKARQGTSYVFVRSGTNWTEQAKLTASGGAADDEFGVSVALDGNDALIGADGCANDQRQFYCAQRGSAYIFARSGSSWPQQAKFSVSEGTESNHFGTSVAIEGGTALIGAPGVSPTGLTYVYTRAGTSWAQQAKLAGDEVGDGSYVPRFGSCVALSGETAISSATSQQVSGLGPPSNRLASAFVHVRSGTSWAPQRKFKPGPGTTDAAFGTSLAWSGDTAIVGAPSRTVWSLVPSKGSALFYGASEMGWTLQQTVTGEAAGFGHAAAVNGDTALIGAALDSTRAEARVFVRSGSTWTQQATLALEQEPDLTLALDGDTALVGSHTARNRVSVFVRSGTAWSLQATLISGGGNFGYSLALEGDTALVGAPDVGDALFSTGGLAYVFVRHGTTWTREAILSRFDNATAGPNDRFGHSVALIGDRALIGAPEVDKAGRAFLFVRSGQTWTRETELSASDDIGYQSFGSSVAFAADRILVGRPGQSMSLAGVFRGSVHLFERSGTAWNYRRAYVAADGADTDLFGATLALQGTRALIAAPLLNGVAPYGNPHEGGVYAVSLEGSSNGGESGAAGAGSGNGGTAGFGGSVTDVGGGGAGAGGADMGGGGTSLGGSGGSGDAEGGSGGEGTSAGGSSEGGSTAGGSRGSDAGGDAGASGRGGSRSSGGASTSGGADVDAGATGSDDGPRSNEGCSCRTPSRSPSGSGAVGALALLILASVRRRSTFPSLRNRD